MLKSLINRMSTSKKGGKPLNFAIGVDFLCGKVKSSVAYVSFHLFPLYVLGYDKQCHGKNKAKKNYE